MSFNQSDRESDEQPENTANDTTNLLMADQSTTVDQSNGINDKKTGKEK